MKTVKQLTFGDSVAAFTSGGNYNWDFNTDSMRAGSLAISQSETSGSYQAELNATQLALGAVDQYGNVAPLASLYTCGSGGFAEIKNNSGYINVSPDEISVYRAQSGGGSGSFEQIASFGSDGMLFNGSNENFYLMKNGYLFSGKASVLCGNSSGYNYVHLNILDSLEFSINKYFGGNSGSVTFGINDYSGAYISLSGTGMNYEVNNSGMTLSGTDSSNCGDFQFYANTYSFGYSGSVSASGGNYNYFEFSFSPSNGLSLCGESPRISIHGYDLVDNCGNLYFLSGTGSGSFSSYTIYPQSITDANGNNYTVLTIQTW